MVSKEDTEVNICIINKIAKDISICHVSGVCEVGARAAASLSQVPTLHNPYLRTHFQLYIDNKQVYIEINCR